MNGVIGYIISVIVILKQIVVYCRRYHIYKWDSSNMEGKLGRGGVTVLQQRNERMNE